MSLATNILIIAAVIPGLFLLWQVYRMDKIEKEPVGLMLSLFFMSILTIIYALVLELAGDMILGMIFPSDSLVYNLLDCFLIIGPAEETGKYLVLKIRSWKHPAFNYRFDGIVYAVCVGVGFAVFENISYAFSYGLLTTIIRAVTAIPAHTIFAIFMGHYYGQAKICEQYGYAAGMKKNIRFALIVPILLHGLYDFIAMSESFVMSILFFAFIIVLDVVTIKRIKKYAREDRPV